MRSTLLILVSGFILTGCGNKGPLYLPPAPIEQIVSESTAVDSGTSDEIEAEQMPDIQPDEPIISSPPNTSTNDGETDPIENPVSEESTLDTSPETEQ